MTRPASRAAPSPLASTLHVSILVACKKTATLEQHMDVQSAIHARDCAHASTQAHRESFRNRLPPRLRAVGRRFDGGPCRPGVRDEDDRGGVASVAPRAAAARPLRSSLPLAAAVARGSEITALSTPQMRPVRPLLRVGVRPRTCAARGDGVWAAARACGATERDPGARTCARCVPLCGRPRPSALLAASWLLETGRWPPGWPQRWCRRACPWPRWCRAQKSRGGLTIHRESACHDHPLRMD